MSGATEGGLAGGVGTPATAQPPLILCYKSLTKALSLGRMPGG